MAVMKDDVNIGLIADKSWAEINLLSPKTKEKLAEIAATLSGGWTAVAEIAVYLILLYVYSQIMLNADSAYDDLSQVTSCAANISKPSFLNLIIMFAMVVLAVRIIFAKLFVMKSKMSIMVEFGLSAFLFVVALIAMIFALIQKNNLNNTAKCNSANADQAKIIAVAKKRANAELNMCFIALGIAGLYMIVNGIRWYTEPAYAKLEGERIIKDLETLPEGILGAGAKVAKGLPATATQEERIAAAQMS